MIILHPILMRGTAHTAVGEPATGATCGSATAVRFGDTGGHGVSSGDIGRGATGVSSGDVGGGAAQRPLTVREVLPAFDRPVERRAEHVAAPAEPVGAPADAAGLLAVEEAGLLELGDHL